MTTLTVEDTAVPIIKKSIHQSEKLLLIKLDNYRQKLQYFENKYKMSSEVFLNKFLNGELGDDAYLIEWEFILEATRKIQDQIDQIHNIII